MVIAEIGGPLIIRAKKEECLIMRKCRSGGYIIDGAYVGNDDLEGKIVIESDVNPILQKPDGGA